MLQVGIRPDSTMSSGSQSSHGPHAPEIPHNPYGADPRQTNPISAGSVRSTPSRPPHQQHPSSSMAQSSIPPRLTNAASNSQPYANPSISRSTSSLPSYSTSSEPSRAAPSEASSSGSSPNSQPIKVRDLAHVVELAQAEAQQAAQARGKGNFEEPRRRYEISGMPVADIIEMVAGLLTKITTTNDRQQGHLQRNMPPADSANLSAISSSVLAFHGRNVPTISIQNYLGRIHRYCPTTYEVFLSLLVYFDRMTERVNKNVHVGAATLNNSTSQPTSSGSSPQLIASNPESPLEPHPPPPTAPQDPSPQFVVDSFNIHRLVIAGVTCASKFFSDVFFTNSRYAKVGGLPLRELNHLELQFLILNDFRLSVPVEELESYGTMLVQFYAREALAQQQQNSGSGGSGGPSPPTPAPSQSSVAATA